MSHSVKHVYNDANVLVSSHVYNAQGQLQSYNDCPAEIYYQDGHVSQEIHCHNGEAHRAEGPAIIDYNSAGEVTYTCYYTHGISAE